MIRELLEILLLMVLVPFFASAQASEVQEAEAALMRNDCTTAVRKLKNAGESGNGDAENLLAGMYAKGLCVDQSDAEAFKWYKSAAAHGDVSAQGNLGFFYLEGRGGATIDNAEALKWLLVAAEKGNIDAILTIGVLYESGRGVTQDPVEAVKRYREAASHGSPIGQFFLGSSYYKGTGVERNYLYSYMWSELAATNGYKDAEGNRSAAAARMSKQQIVEARRLASQCRVRKFHGCE